HVSLYPGAADFLHRCRDLGARVWIVSHKTEFNQYGHKKVNLRAAALEWMEDRGFFDSNGFGFSRDEVYFEQTRDDKLARLASLRCTHVVDDLVEVLTDPGFPTGPRRILFDPTDGSGGGPLFECCSSWEQIGREIFGAPAPEAHDHYADAARAAS
ncbi:MAG TPA: hypothetical protein VL984_13510, partial [Acidimicrobiales bacterium]|nr:hypothetical protein [Acidimicrobiales bacterium]